LAAKSWRDIPELYEDGQVATVLELAQSVPDELRKNAGVLGFVAYALRDVARYAEAEVILHELREASSSQGAAIFEGEIAAVHERTGRFEEAEKWYRRATETCPADASRFVLLGAFLARMGRTEEAEAVHRVGTQCEEGPVDEAWLNLGLVQRSLGRYDRAAFSFRQALTRAEGYTEAETALQDVVEAARLSRT